MKTNKKPLPSEDELKQALKDVIDPELGINIVDLGLLYSIQISDEGISVDMTLTTPGCPMSEVLPLAVENKIHEAILGNGLPVEVSLVWEPAWNPDLITEEGKRSLGIT